MAEEDKRKIIDVKKVIKEKSPGFYKYAPSFIIKYIQKILHEDDVNQFIHEHRDDSPIDFCLSVMKKFNIQVTTEGLENVPENGGVVLAMNHPLGGMDAMALVTVIHEKRPDVKFIVNDVLLNLDNLKSIFVGVDVVNKKANGSLMKVDDLFTSDNVICIFPAGLVSRKIDGVVQDLEWKKTFISRSIMHKKNIIPVYIEGRLSNFFYNLYSLRKKLGIKGNIEMLYLVNELYKQHNVKIKISFGELIHIEKLDDSRSHRGWAKFVKEEVYKLRK
ncbi:MAG: 1-acyl-sn-glycerol-3-phosphate acyltransferase [Brumimicrobium sp.]|nr:1-acyl-sn-glycerol-3-phosphate acyltransferase [Brumimicrobium sp.]MCO5268994.1 1-acyl-sn-glycerol-3-phosphate acyltransferase [Brumimicrobium sp.]